MSPTRVRPRPQRRYPRLTLRVEVELETAAGRTRAVATTLGAGGLFVADDAPWFPGTPVTVRFRLPGDTGDADAESGGDDGELRLDARVAWSHEAGESASPGMGLEFVDADARADLARRLERWAVDREKSDAEA